MIGNTRLGTDVHVVSDGDVPGYSHLSAHHAMAAYFCRAGDAALGSHYGILAYFYVVGYLYEVVEFYTLTYDGRSHSGPVDGCIGSDLDMVFENDIPYLRYFHVRTVVRGKSEPIGTDNGSCMYDAVIAYHAIVIYFYSRIDDSSHPYFYIVADIGLWIDFTPFAEDCIFSDICKGSYVYRLGKYGRRCNICLLYTSDAADD